MSFNLNTRTKFTDGWIYTIYKYIHECITEEMQHFLKQIYLSMIITVSCPHLLRVTIILWNFTTDSRISTLMSLLDEEQLPLDC